MKTLVLAIKGMLGWLDGSPRSRFEMNHLNTNKSPKARKSHY